ncbi:hypothetical protein T09_15698 [Trichinella sp. T9]|nr:hypothetical protein T09_15698 [Trichinella sp. T9]
MLVARWRGSNKEFAFVSVDAASVSDSQNGCVGCLHGPVVEEGYFLQTLRPMCCSALCDVVVILLNLMIWHSNCWDKRSRTVVVPHTQDVYFGFFPITSELPDVEVLHCACVSGGFAVIEVDKSFYPIVQPSLIIGIVKKCTKCLVCERI